MKMMIEIIITILEENDILKRMNEDFGYIIPKVIISESEKKEKKIKIKLNKVELLFENKFVLI